MDTLRPCPVENRAHLGLKKRELPRIDRAGAVDGDRDLPDALAYHSWQVETRPDMATVWSHPAIVGRDRIRPEPPQQFSPIDSGLCRPFKRSVEAGWNLARLPRNCRSLVDRHIPLSRLFFNGWGCLVRRWRIEDL